MKKIIIALSIIILLLIGFTKLYFNSNNQLGNLDNKTIEKTNNKKNTKQEKNRFVSYNGKLKIKGTDLVNQYDEKIQLKGISTHGIQWYSQYANKEVMSTLKNDWNANLFRIALYTEENGYISNKDLKSKVYEIVNYAIDLDMYVIIDWHILSDNNPNKYKKEAIEFFSEMSKKYKNTPNVIFEICNEPNGNTNWHNDIKPYAIDVINEIRKNSDGIIIVGTGTWSQDILDPANDKLDFDNIMYACHFYAGTHTEWLRNRILEAKKNIPIFVSEWGVSSADGNGGVYLEESLKWVNFMNENNISWANWSLSDKNESSALLLPNTPVNDISDKYLSESGKFVKKQIKK